MKTEIVIVEDNRGYLAFLSCILRGRKICGRTFEVKMINPTCPEISLERLCALIGQAPIIMLDNIFGLEYTGKNVMEILESPTSDWFRVICLSSGDTRLFGRGFFNKKADLTSYTGLDFEPNWLLARELALILNGLSLAGRCWGALEPEKREEFCKILIKRDNVIPFKYYRMLSNGLKALSREDFPALPDWFQGHLSMFTTDQGFDSEALA